MAFYLISQEEITSQRLQFKQSWICQECGAEPNERDIRYFVKIANDDTITVCGDCKQTLETKHNVK